MLEITALDSWDGVHLDDTPSLEGSGEWSRCAAVKGAFDRLQHQLEQSAPKLKGSVGQT